MSQDTKSMMKVIVFQLKDEEYTIPVDRVGSIERLMPITRVPRTPSFVKGVINLRGVVTPIIDLRERFELSSAKDTEQTRIITVTIEEMDVGLIVDAANDVLDINEDSIEPPPEVVGTIEADYIQGVVKYEHRLLILLNLINVLSQDEIKELQDVAG